MAIQARLEERSRLIGMVRLKEFNLKIIMRSLWRAKRGSLLMESMTYQRK